MGRIQLAMRVSLSQSGTRPPIERTCDGEPATTGPSWSSTKRWHVGRCQMYLNRLWRCPSWPRSVSPRLVPPEPN